MLVFLAAGTVAHAAPLALYVTDGDVIHGFNATTGAPLPGFADIALLGATGLAVGPDSNLYAANTIPSQVFRYDAATGTQIGAAPFVSFNGQNDGHDVQNPQGMRFGPGGNLYIADETDSNVHVYGPAGNSLTTFTGPSVTQPTDVTFDAAGNLYAASGGGVAILHPGDAAFSDFVTAFSGPGVPPLNNPGSLAIGPDGRLYVLDISASSTEVVAYATNTGPNPAGTVFVSFTGPDLGLFQPADLAFGPDGKLYVSGLDFNTSFGEVLRFTAAGAADGVFETGLVNPTFLAFSTPEPASMVLFAVGIPMLLVAASRRRRRA
jgi:sugar lactone lactonase YvrE